MDLIQAHQILLNRRKHSAEEIEEAKDALRASGVRGLATGPGALASLRREPPATVEEMLEQHERLQRACRDAAD